VLIPFGFTIQLYRYVWEDAELSHMIRQCLAQLVDLPSDIFANIEINRQHSARIITGIRDIFQQ